jgi:iron(III) transport system substrate-binding protein
MTTLLLAVFTAAAAISWQPAFAWPPLAVDETLIEGAKKEEKLVFYTTIELPQMIQLIQSFMQTYPFLDVEIHPLETETLVKRVRYEHHTHASGCDVLLGGGAPLQPLFDERLLAPYHSPQRDGLSEALADNHGYWSGYYINPYVLGFNTFRVTPDKTPKAYDDLIHSRWKGSQIAIDSTAHALLRGLTPIWGGQRAVDFLRRLAAQQPVMAQTSLGAVDSMHTGNVSLVIARAPVIHGYKVKLSSPIEWVSLEPVIAQIDAVMLSARSPHPNAARLFIDFALSHEGQNALSDVQQLPVRPAMKPPSKRSVEAQKWFLERPDRHADVQESIKLFREIFGIP